MDDNSMYFEEDYMKLVDESLELKKISEARELSAANHVSESLLAEKKEQQRECRENEAQLLCQAHMKREMTRARRVACGTQNLTICSLYRGDRDGFSRRI